ncbi:TRP-like ion channel [Metarhizium album ARSEF 1941]|uniref:TRP-like ion channel n=1 Tax=Metarhizium album (strain ARSEF 1941) TaxID=1081103 RepID=A0A0B2WXG7_METAS|nr:TRP-like ion channel [Metarhizium album ARSEF 1941]KHO00977.1 TRP-like ion channel [Metarhizium album ARSEF 1941]
MPRLRLRFPAVALLSLLILLSCPFATANEREPVYIQGLGLDGVKRELDVSRYPALYTGDFDDCLGGQSLFNVTKFDAAYYADNLTVLFHLDGTTNIHKENLILHISVEAYGENRFNMTYDPCKANIHSMCPLNNSVPITAFAAIPLAPHDVSGIPSIALGIPDLEGLARLQIFANSTQTEIGCFQAAMTNGNTFSQPEAVASFVGVMVFMAVLASFATAIYGLSIPHMRVHYAHSFSVLVIFETFQTIFFSGALSVNWPSVLPAWWSNFAWTAGMFANNQIVSSVSSFTGNDVNITQVGGAGSVQINNGGGLSQQIYGRSLFAASLLQGGVGASKALARRNAYNASDPYDYTWGGHPRTPGMPMPGTWPGFGGTLSAVNIPPDEAFIISIIWLLVVVAAVACFVVAVKLSLDVLVKLKWLKTDGFDYFRSHVWDYTASALLRTLFIAFFTVMTLAMYQFSLRGSAGPTAVAAIVWLIFLLGVGGVTVYACYFRLRHGKYDIGPDSLRFERDTVFGKVPFIATTRQSKIGEEEPSHRPYLLATLPFVKIKYIADDPNRDSVHLDEGYIKRFGWLSVRYRRSRWWFFAVYLGYQFIRACFIGGAARSPLAQVYGLFIFDIIALVVIMKLNPFESNRNTAVAVWMLSISKILTTGLSIAFLPAFSISRIVATVLGIIIIVVQGFVAVAVLILIILGVISTWMSLSRNREEFPQTLQQIRINYFEHAEARADDIPSRPKKSNKEEMGEGPQEAIFAVREVRRAPKIEDEDVDKFPDLDPHNMTITGVGAGGRRSRANSASSRFSVSSLPRAARVHRASWSSKDIPLWDSEMNRGDQQRVGHSRASSLRLSGYHVADAPGTSTPVRRPMTPQEEILEEPPVQHSDSLPTECVDSSQVSEETRAKDKEQEDSTPEIITESSEAKEEPKAESDAKEAS